MPRLFFCLLILVSGGRDFRGSVYLTPSKKMVEFFDGSKYTTLSKPRQLMQANKAMNEPTDFEKEYSEEGFWNKLTDYAKSAGIEVVEKALLLYYAAQEETTPTWAKATIMGALGYFISLLDAVPDLTPVIGYTDDLGVLVMAIATISAHINQGARDKTQQKLASWFGDSSSEESD